MPSIAASLKRHTLIVRFNAAGDDVETVEVVNDLLKDGTDKVSPGVVATFTKAEAAGVGVTGAQLQAFLTASETLRSSHETTLLA